jgi:acyl carrier protein
MSFTIEDLTRIAREAIGDRRIQLTPAMAAKDVPGWDSLNHTVISMTIASEFGVDLTPKQLGEAETFGAVIELVNRAMGAAA